MSDKEFELYLSLLSRFLRLRPNQRQEIADELRDHLEERLDELTADGLSRDEAVRQALDEFGDAAELAAHFSHLARRRRRRFLMRCTLGSIGAAAAVILIAFAMWPPMPDVNLPLRAEGQQPVAQDDPAPILGNESGPTGLETDPNPLGPNNDRQSAVEAKLAQKIDVSFIDIPLEKALSVISQRIEVDVVINEQSLEGEGITLDAPVNLHLTYTEIPASTALELIFERAAGPGMLTYKIRDGFLYVQTAIAAEEDLEIEVYDVRDLLEGVKPVRRRFPGLGGGVGGGGGFLGGTGFGGGGGFFQVGPIGDPANVNRATGSSSKSTAWPDTSAKTDPLQAPGTPAQPPACYVEISPVEALIDVIQNNTSGPWINVDGAGGMIDAFDDMLVVRQTQAAHREIKQLLEMLRVASKERDAKK